jgi:hypothetical protein
MHGEPQHSRYEFVKKVLKATLPTPDTNSAPEKGENISIQFCNILGWAVFTTNQWYFLHQETILYVVCKLTGFLLWRRYRRQFSGEFFKGAFLPQKLVDLTPF